MKDENKTEAQLINPQDASSELTKLRQRVAELEVADAERKRVEEALRHETGFAKSLVETAQAIVLVLDLEGRIVHFNPYMEKISGYRLEQVQGKDWFTTFLPERERNRIQALFSKAIEDHQTRGNVNPIITQDGSERVIEWWDATLKDTDGHVTGLLAIGHNITERVRMEEELRRHRHHLETLVKERTAELATVNEQLREEIAERERTEEALRAEKTLMDALMDNTTDSIYFKDLQCRLTRINRKMMRDLNLDEMSQAVGKTDTDLFGQEFGQKTLVQDRHILKTGEPLIGLIENRQLENRQINWTSTTKIPLRDASGQIVGLVGVTREINELIRAEEALRESEARHRSLIESSDDMIFSVDRAGVFKTAGGMRLREFGLKPEDIVGRSLEELLGEEARQYQERHWQVFESGEAMTYEHSFEFAGITKTDLTTVYPIKNENGTIELVGVICRDITERKQTEEALYRYAQRLESLHEIDRTILAAQSPEAIARVALSHIRHLVPCQRASVVTFDSETDTARVLAVHVDDQTRIGTGKRVPLKEFAAVLGQREVRVVDIENMPPLSRSSAVNQALQAEGIRSYMNIPLIVQNETIGLMNIGTINPSAFTPEYIDIASEVGDSLAVAIRQAQLHEQVQQVAETKARLLREVNHRVRNNLTAIISLLSLEQGRTGVDNQVTYQAIMEDLIKRIQGLATVHHLLSVTNWSALSLSELTKQVINSALQTLPPDKSVAVNVSTSPIQIPPQEANNLALLVNELTTNAIKYAWPARQTGRIGVNIDREDDQVLLEFRDDGVGYSDEVLSLERHSIGWELIQAIVVDGLRGEVTLHNDRGAVATIRFPAPV